MDHSTDRPAPGALALVQEFLNAPVEEPSAEDLHLGDEMRRLAAIGESQAGIAARFGVSQQLVSAVLRERRLVGPVGSGLGSPAAFGMWLAGHGFEAAVPVTDAAHARVLALHGALLAMALANNGEPLPAGTMQTLSLSAESARFRLAFGNGPEIQLAPVGAGAERFIEAVLLAVYEAQRDGTWQRLKACPAEHCQHVFYDSSRNRTASWCSMAICGNRAKVRAYQERRRSPARR